MKNNNFKWILLVIAALLLFGMKGTLPKEAVADISGNECVKNSDCPCFGKYNMSGVQEEAYGIGISNCIDCNLNKNINKTACKRATHRWACDTTYCYDIQGVGEWTRDHPWEWMKQKENVMVVMAIILLIIGYFAWPSI